MIKNNSKMPETYESPAVQVTRIRTRRVMCGSGPYGELNNPGYFYEDGDENVHDYDAL